MERPPPPTVTEDAPVLAVLPEMVEFNTVRVVAVPPWRMAPPNAAEELPVKRLLLTVYEALGVFKKRAPPSLPVATFLENVEALIVNPPKEPNSAPPIAARLPEKVLLSTVN